MGEVVGKKRTKSKTVYTVARINHSEVWNKDENINETKLPLFSKILKMLVQEFRGCSVEFPRKLYERPGSHFFLICLIPRIKAERYLISIYNFEVFYKEIQ